MNQRALKTLFALMATSLLVAACAPAAAPASPTAKADAPKTQAPAAKTEAIGLARVVIGQHDDAAVGGDHRAQVRERLLGTERGEVGQQPRCLE
jgi:hypothetical protein